MQSPLLKFRQRSLIPKKLHYLSGKFKILTDSNYRRVLIFSAEILHTFATNQCVQKGVQDSFIFFRTWFIDKSGSCKCVKPSLLFWKITQDLNKMKQISNTLFNTLLSTKRVQKLLSSWSLSKFSIVQTKYLTSLKQ